MKEKMLGEILVENKFLTKQQLDEALKIQNTSPLAKPLGTLLLELGHLKEPALQAATALCESRERLFDVLVNYNFATKEEIELAYEMSQNEKISIFRVLLNLDFMNYESIAKAISIATKLPFVHLSDRLPNIKTGLAKSIINFVSGERKLVPIALDGRKVTIAVTRPLGLKEIKTLEDLINLKVETVIAPEDEVVKVQKFFTLSVSPEAGQPKAIIPNSIQELVADDAESIEVEYETQTVTEKDSLLVKLVNKIIYDAWTRRASDIHIEPGAGKQDILVRMRVDGCCEIYERLPYRFKYAIPSRLKIMANLDISERRKPQDGKIDFEKFGPADIELRIATMPTVGGLEDVVLRLLTNAEPVEFKHLGLTERNYREFEAVIHKPYGLILVVGPTGSGKTTTLHSAIATINNSAIKIWTAEDPVEITQPGLRQVQVNPKIGLSFAVALRSFLRLDPDIIMVGEMRDHETASIAIESSLTGHLVFSTLHTNSAPETLTRLLDMGIDPFGFADSLLCILAQRLARRLCDQCREKYSPSDKEWQELVNEYGQEDFAASGIDRSSVTLARPVGCPQCNNSGYRGRMGIHELLVSSDGIREAIKSRAPTDTIKLQAAAGGMTSLRQDGILKVMQGITDIHEIRRVCIK